MMAFSSNKIWYGAISMICALACESGAGSSDLGALAQPQTEDEAGEPTASEERTDFSKYILPEPTIYCPSDDGSTGIDNTGLFYPLAINAELARFPALQKAVGSGKVETCNQAHAWAEARGSIVNGEPPSTDPVPIDPPDAAAPLLKKIWGGVTYADDSQPRFDNLSANTMCSTVAITRRHLLTSAHCVLPNTTLCNGYPCNPNGSYTMWRAVTAPRS